MNKTTINRSRSINRSMALGALTLAAIVPLFPTAAVATPPEGIVSATVFATAVFADPTDIKFRIRGLIHEVDGVPNAQATVLQQLIISPGGHTGWHSHPGPVVVLVKAGEVTLTVAGDPCTVRTYSAGQSFVDGPNDHVQIARNEGSVNLEAWVTYFDVPADGIFRIDEPDPGTCGF